MRMPVVTSIGVVSWGERGGLLLTAPINMCYVRFSSPILCRPSHFSPETTNYDRKSRKRTALLIVLWLIK